ncbi:MAG: hypothetical protein ACP5Q0_06170, partial [Halothiobacillus sp.]
MSTHTTNSAQDLLGMMRAGMGRVPAAIEKSTFVDDGLIQEHMRSRMYAMPKNGALTEETRTRLSELARSRTAPAHHVERSAVILHLADQNDVNEVAAKLG